MLLGNSSDELIIKLIPVSLADVLNPQPTEIARLINHYCFSKDGAGQADTYAKVSQLEKSEARIPWKGWPIIIP